jgi:hypothetical protein
MAPPAVEGGGYFKYKPGKTYTFFIDGWNSLYDFTEKYTGMRDSTMCMKTRFYYFKIMCASLSHTCEEFKKANITLNFNIIFKNPHYMMCNPNLYLPLNKRVVDDLDAFAEFEQKIKCDSIIIDGESTFQDYIQYIFLYFTNLRFYVPICESTDNYITDSAKESDDILTLKLTIDAIASKSVDIREKDNIFLITADKYYFKWVRNPGTSGKDNYMKNLQYYEIYNDETGPHMIEKNIKIGETDRNTYNETHKWTISDWDVDYYKPFRRDQQAVQYDADELMNFSKTNSDYMNLTKFCNFCMGTDNIFIKKLFDNRKFKINFGEKENYFPEMKIIDYGAGSELDGFILKHYIPPRCSWSDPPSRRS